MSGADPFGDSYAYVGGMVESATDPSGHTEKEIADAGGGAGPEGGDGAGANAAGAASAGDGMAYTENTFVSTGDGGSIETTVSGDTFTYDAEGNITEINGISTAGDNAAATTENQASVHDAQVENANPENGGKGGNGGQSGQNPNSKTPSANVQQAANENAQQQAEVDAQAQANAAAKGDTEWNSPATGRIVTEDADTGEVLDNVSNLRGRNPLSNHVEANGPRATPRITQRLATRGYQGNVKITVIVGKPFCPGCQNLIPD